MDKSLKTLRTIGIILTSCFNIYGLLCAINGIFGISNKLIGPLEGFQWGQDATGLSDALMIFIGPLGIIATIAFSLVIFVLCMIGCNVPVIIYWIAYLIIRYFAKRQSRVTRETVGND